ncbi:MAG TPA: NAD-dependent epimerase/dehydratase family protein [Nitrososphaeraceae archaeon]|nr:NAD-dependent epimerase/dehydratase family protein [Nitrososphaeraceae archaeon]
MDDIISKKILVTGVSGFIGSNLLRTLMHKKNTLGYPYEIRCITRNKKSMDSLKISNKDIEILEGDLSNYDDCLKALEGVDVAYFLVHSMEGSTKKWKEFSEKEKTVAENFMRATTHCNVKRIIYLGGLIHAKDDTKSQHMLSRKIVGEILLKSKTPVTIFRAAVILGSGGSSFEMLRYLVDRLPVMVCPKWVTTKCQPIFIGDVITYLVQSIEIDETTGKEYEIGGPDVISYLQMMKIYAKKVGKSICIITIPLLTAKLSSYWIELITPVKGSLAKPLVESLEHDSIVEDHSINEVIPLELKSFEESIEYCLKDENKYKNTSIKQMIKERTSFSLNYKVLLVSLVMLLFIGTTYYFLDTRKDFLNPIWIVLAVFWYLSIIISIYFIRYGAKLGALLAGIVGWATLVFWLMDNYYIIGGNSILFSNPNTNETWRNMIGIFIAAFTIISSHNIYNKERVA